MSQSHLQVQQIAGKSERLIIGLMSGTSLDGVDAALVRIYGSGTETKVEMLAFECQPYSDAEREMLKKLCSPDTSNVQHICMMNFHLAHRFAAIARSVATRAGIPWHEIDLLSSHGQTIWHAPEVDPTLPFSVPSTLQIGDLSVLAKETGKVVIGDYRTADMALQGQGAPLTPYADYMLCRHPSKGRITQNIGGIGNCTVLSAGGMPTDVIAFDTGPGNMLIDQAVIDMSAGTAYYDHNGELAASGQVNEPILSRMLAHPYFSKVPMKTTGRELFGKRYAEEWIEQMKLISCSPHDIVATFTAFTARSIAQSYRDFIFPKYSIAEIIVSGGGTRNHTLMAMLQQLLPELKVMTHEEIGINSDAKEAVAFALLANEWIDGNPNPMHHVTGASHATVMGKLALP
ncbi:anhydro-N-acetylmuramic acid kinase [Paenibacillus sp. SC116]|uniref:anhydro-N-acetylmuramic acid kinase n=1 Tax=Paenibacillus sp. SC116 TaxID=2968986 RepID=UPI00215B2E68|nr:anhydro-N-acetylmuramic acid kinase [Paenibacillus sp. SC116]MCR8843459.1 anhydro-N-acetylmuramic acid kinase [Paenibacillus sp. SC116]